MNTRATLILLMLSLTVSLAACGRKGALDTPYEAAVEAREEARDNDEPLPPEPQRPNRDRPFFLDPLI